MSCATDPRVWESLPQRQTSHPLRSQQLAVLRTSGVVTARRHGAEIVYRVANPKIVRICDLMREGLAEQAAGQSDLLEAPGHQREQQLQVDFRLRRGDDASS